MELLARRTTARGVNSSPAAVTTVARRVLCRGLEIAMEIADKALDGHSDYAHWQEPL